MDFILNTRYFYSIFNVHSINYVFASNFFSSVIVVAAAGRLALIFATKTIWHVNSNQIMHFERKKNNICYVEINNTFCSMIMAMLLTTEFLFSDFTHFDSHQRTCHSIFSHISRK